MLIDNELRKCVAFLFVDETDEENHITIRTPKATVFFVSMPFEEVQFVYAVTARHNIESARRYDQFYIRLNTKKESSQDFDDIPIKAEDWICHPTTDIAAILASLPQRVYDYLPLPLSMVLNDETVANRRIGIGDDVFILGLYSRHSGSRRNQPIVRFGNISLMPHEPIPVTLYPKGTAKDVLVDAYLIEAKSWGGHSGSPVFVYYPPHRELGYVRLKGTGPELLGLIHGHHDIPQEVKFTGDVLGTGKVPVNAGIAIVIPAQKIIDLLMEETFVEDRKKRHEEHKKARPSTTPDFAPTDQPLTREAFERTLKKASRRKREQGKPQT